MNEVEQFELGTILTITTGYNCVDNFDKVWNLVWFVCNDNMIGPIGLEMVKDEVKNHLLAIHPEIKDVKYQRSGNIREFITEQEEKFGSFLPVTKLGMKLTEKYVNVTESPIKSLKN